MITNDKQALLNQMEQQRFLPITEDTLKLYDSYNAVIDAHNPDELCCLLFYKGEYFFRTGNFIEAINYLTRCLQAPKHEEYLHYDALSYNLIGIIYTYLNQECVAINNLLLGKSISETYHFPREFAICCGNIGNVYSQIDDFETSIHYYTLAIEYLEKNNCGTSKIALLCEIYRCILYCKSDNRSKALSAYEKINTLLEQIEQPFFTASIFNLNIRLYEFLQDKAFLEENLNQLLQFKSSYMDFLEHSNSYFDSFDYLLQKKMLPEALSLLEYMKNPAAECPLNFLKQHYLHSQLAYAKAVNDNEAYISLTNQLLKLHPVLSEDERTAKLYSLDYIERLHQTKNDSEIFREKSQLDQMTGLLNKYTIQFFVEEDLSTAPAEKRSAMILIDLDHFKQINDTLGHLAGDSFICQTASIIKDYFKESAFCGRVGGDEFLIYLPNVSDPSFVVLQSEILRQEIQRKTSKQNITVTTPASIGIAFSSEYCYNYETMFNKADEALYRAKLEGRNKVIVAKQDIC